MEPAASLGSELFRGDNMIYKAVSDVGNVRSVNEDFGAAQILGSGKDEVGIFAIADGMGGHNKGEVASRIAVENVMEYLKGKVESAENDIDSIVVENLIKSYESSNDMILKEAQKSEAFHGMGTTLTVAVIAKGKMYVGNVGDSRCYLFSEKKLHRVTNDNSLVQEMVLKGLITEEEARRHPQRNIITRAVGLDKPLKVDVYERDVIKGDHILLTTDGLTNMVAHDEMQEVILNFENIDQSCEELLSRAKDSGGDDNISLVHILI